MTEQRSSIRLFQLALHGWVLAFLISALPAMGDLWLAPISPPVLPSGPFTVLTHALGLWLPRMAVFPMVALAIGLCLTALFRPTRWWSAALIWVVYVNLMHSAWLAGSGGQQLVANLLFWNILLSLPTTSAIGTWFSTAAFWMIRGQLLLAYAVTGMHKLTGHHWIDGTSLGIVATDAAFGPSWMAAVPVLAQFITWCVLVFQFTFPLAVWFRPTRLPWMAFGAIFHVGTAVWMDIPEMGFAFLAAYPIWLSKAESDSALGWMRRMA